MPFPPDPAGNAQHVDSETSQILELISISRGSQHGKSNACDGGLDNLNFSVGLQKNFRYPHITQGKTREQISRKKKRKEKKLNGPGRYKINEPVWPSEGVRLVSRKASARFRFGSPPSLKTAVCGRCLVTLSVTVNETLKWLSSPHLNAEFILVRTV